MKESDGATQADMAKQIREKKIVAAVSVAAAVFLTGAKLVVGFMTGSLGILAEAAHSGLDLAAAMITYFAVRVSDRPADAEHLYGHGKVENLSALVEALLLLLTCTWIIYEAVRRLFFASVEVDPSVWAFLVMGTSIAVDISRSRALSRVARKYRSQALEADALHFSTDIWSSAVVILGLVLVRLGERLETHGSLFMRADAVAALLVAAIVVAVSLRLGGRAVDVLLDRAPKGLAERLSQKVGEIAGILRVSRVRVRDAGSQVFVDLNVDVPRHFSFQESHQLTRRAQEAVRSVSPRADVVVHTNPIAESETLLEVIQAVAARERVFVHNITTHWTERGMWIDLDLEVDPEISFEQAHAQATELEARLSSELAATEAAALVAGINVHIEPRGEDSAVGTPLDAAEADLYGERVRRVAEDIQGTAGCHDIELHRVRGKLYLSLHLLVDSGIPIAEVHGIAEEMESRLRREFPELGRVMIHAEPRSAGDEGPRPLGA